MTPILITGGAGFIGSNLIERLLKANSEVICLDNLTSGKKKNIDKFLLNSNFTFINQDITNKINIDTKEIWHLACPASPYNYQKDPVETSKINFLGTLNILENAKKFNSKLIFASTSEVYGDPENHPQDESYNGSVNPIGVRSCYTEGKRIAESLCFDFYRKNNLNIKIARIFNTYGPKMDPNDGRVISNFINRALNNQTLKIYGNGTQTRSFCFIDDLISGLIKLMNSKHNGPINLGNPYEEYNIKFIADKIIKMTNSKSNIIKIDSIDDDPKKRKPSIAKAKALLNWEPKIKLDKGLEFTIKYFKKYNNEQ